MSTLSRQTPYPPRKKISRRKPGEKSLSNYFDENTQKAIARCQETVTRLPDGKKIVDFKERNRIYTQDISPAFSALIENLISVYGFHVQHESRSDLKNECLEFLQGVIDKFDVNNGSKAFSYFNVVAKNWLTIKSKQNARIIQNYISLDNKDAFTKHDLDLIEDFNTVRSAEDVLTETDNSKNLKLVMEGLEEKTKTENERVCLDAIKLVVENLENVELLNKRAIMLYIREITGMSSKQLSIALSAIKKQYKIVKEDMINNASEEDVPSNIAPSTEDGIRKEPGVK